MKHELQRPGSIHNALAKSKQRVEQDSDPAEPFVGDPHQWTRNGDGREPDLPTAVERLIDEWLAENTDSITAELVEHFSATIHKGIQEAYDFWNERLGTNFTRVLSLVARVLLIAGKIAKNLIGKLRPHISRAVRKLIKKLKSEDKSDLQILDAVQRFLEHADLVAELLNQYTKEGDHEAFEMGRLLGNEALGATEKAWITAGDNRVDAICLANEADGEIPIRDRFSSGHLTPPAHRGCRCTAVYFGVSRRSMYWASQTFHQ